MVSYENLRAIDTEECSITEEGIKVINRAKTLMPDTTIRENNDRWIDKINNIERELPMKYLDKGVSRLAFRIMDESLITGEGEYVVKITPDSNPFQNEMEVFVWEETKKKHGRVHEMLADICAYDEDFKWIVMEYISGPVTYQQAKDTAEKLEDMGVEFEDAKKANVGKSDGEIKIFDYGLLKFE